VGRAVRQHRDLIDAKGEVITYEYAGQVQVTYTASSGSTTNFFAFMN
jgi:hypothetical protein